MALDLGSYLVILIATIFLIFLWKASAFVFSQSNVPEPKGNWLTGQMFELMQSKDTLQTLQKWTKMYGPIVRYRPKGVFGKEKRTLIMQYSDSMYIVSQFTQCSQKFMHSKLKGPFWPSKWG